MADSQPLAEVQFVDLEIRIFAREENGYPVEITLGGQQEYPRGYLEETILPWDTSGDLIADGERLFASLFADPVLREAWAECRGRAARRRIRLRVDTLAPELHALPWELLQEDGMLLTAGADTPFSRYLPIALPWGSLVEERPIRVLAALSNPADLEIYNLTAVDVTAERESLIAAFQEAGDAIQVDFLDPPITLERLDEALRQSGGYHILHYVGHGAFGVRHGLAVLYLQDKDGNTQIVSDDALIGMLARLPVRPRLIFLAACQSATRATGDAFRGLGPKLVAAGAPAVLAMQDSVSLATARQVGAVFYRRLVESGAVDCALNAARSALLTSERPDAAVPVLFMRLKSGQLWSAEADARGSILGRTPPQDFWPALIRRIENGECIPIIGSRVHGRWLPPPQEIAQRWVQTYGYLFTDVDDLAAVGQYLATTQGEDYPRQELLETLRAGFIERLPAGLHPDGWPTGMTLKEQLRVLRRCYPTLTALIRAVGWSNLVSANPNEIHTVLSGLNLPLYLTTNADNFMVEALAARGHPPVREICRWNKALLQRTPSHFEADAFYEPTPDTPMVYHLFGYDEDLRSLVLTENDYLDFLVRISDMNIPQYILGALASSSLLFLGYNLHDWEFKVIMRGLLEPLTQRLRLNHVAVQLEDTGDTDAGAVQNFLERYFQDADINVYWGSPAQFVAELREHWEGDGR